MPIAGDGKSAKRTRKLSPGETKRAERSKVNGERERERKARKF